MTDRHDVIIAGLGPVGLASALALAHVGMRVTVVGRAAAERPDGRAIALMRPSVAMLERLGVWREARAVAQPMTGLRIVDATGRLLRAPETLFRAEDIGFDSFGACIAVTDLSAHLRRRVNAGAAIRVIETEQITGIDIGHRDVTVRLAEGKTLTAPLLVGADGRRSPSRAAAGIATREWTYPQTAIALVFGHERPHDGVSIEFHRGSGPLTTVPLPGRVSSLVWVEAPHEAARIAALEPDALSRTLRAALHGVLGRIHVVSPCSTFPLSGMSANTLGQRRVALVGEAAHVFPPIGAQGMNLGLRDVAALADALQEARATVGGDPGAPDVLDAYARARQADVWSRTTAVDLLNRSLLSAQLPVQALRGLGMHLLSALGPVRRVLMQRGVAPAGKLPRLMRPTGG